MTKKASFEVEFIECRQKDGVVSKEWGPHGSVTFLLPLKLCNKLMEEQQLKEKQEKQDAELERNRKLLDTHDTISVRYNSKDDDDDDDYFVQNLSQEIAKLEKANSNLNVQSNLLVYHHLEPIKLLRKSNSTSDSDLSKRDITIYQQMCRLGPVRALNNPALRDDFDNIYQVIKKKHVNFSVVIDYVFGVLSSMRNKDNKVVRINPILLVGPAGVGKSFFAQDLAKAIGVNYHLIQMDSAVTRMTFVGSDRRYNNTAPGEIFNFLCLGKIGNPVVILDELDKTSQFQTNENALMPLHSLLEPVTSTQFTDVSTTITFNASMITWIATANDLSCIPTTLRSRFREYVISPPTGENAISVCLSVLQHAVAVTAPSGFQLPDKKIAVALAHLTAREIFKVTERAIANALSNNRQLLELNDYSDDMSEYDIEISNNLIKKTKSDEWLH